MKKNVVLLLLATLSVITFLDRNAISIASVRITSELGLTDSQFGWILTAFTLSYGLLEIPMGLWGDRYGEKNVLLRIVLLWSAFTALTGLAGGFLSLFIIRLLFGAGEAGAYPNSAISIGKWFSPGERGRAQAWIWSASRIGGAVAPLLVIPLQQSVGWRATFGLLGLTGAIWALIWWLTYREPDARRSDSQPTLTAGSWTIHLRSGTFWRLMVMYYCYACGVFFFISWLPRYLQQGRGMSEDQLAWNASAPFLLAAIGCLAGGYISDWLVHKIGPEWGRKAVPAAGLMISGISMLLAVNAASDVWAVVFLTMGLAFMDVTAPVSWALATDLGLSSSGAVTGAMNTAGLLGGTATSLGIGYLLQWTGNYHLPVTVIAVQLIAGAVCALTLSEISSSRPK
ncbi:MAG: MFS transporter [Bacteroidota bacterium]